MKKLLLNTLLFLIFIFFSWGQNTTSVEIFYTQVGKFKYAVQANAYRRCDMADLGKLVGFVYGGTHKIAMNFNRTAIKNISDTCGNPCDNQNQFSNAGIEKHTFVDTINFEKAPYKAILDDSICMVHFAINQDIRDYPISNMQTKNLFIDAKVNLCHGMMDIKSPVFTINPAYKIPGNVSIKCSPGIKNFSPLDSLNFVQGDVQHDWQQNVGFLNNFSKSAPITPFCPPTSGVLNCRPFPNGKPARGFSYNNQICEFIFTPINIGETSILKYVVEQYRYDTIGQKFVYIGSISREQVISIIMAKSKYVEFTNTNFLQAICDNQDITIKRSVLNNTSLPKTKDSITISSNDVDIKTTNLNQNQLDFEFKINNSNKYLASETNYYTISARSNFCNSSASITYKITTLKSKKLKVDAKQIANCNLYVWENNLADTVLNNQQVLGFSSVAYNLKQPQKEVFNRRKQKDTFKITESGTYVFVHQIFIVGEKCSAIEYDTVQLTYNSFFEQLKTDTLVCVGQTVALGKSFNLMAYHKVRWEFPIGTTLADTGHILNFTQTNGNNIIRRRYTNAFCSFFEDINVFSNIDFNLNLNDTSLCLGNETTVKIKNILVNKPYHIAWYLNNVVQQSNLDSFVFILDSTKTIMAELSINKACASSKTVVIDVIPNDIEFAFQKDAFCEKTMDTISLVFKNPGANNLIYEWKINDVLSSNQLPYFVSTVDNINKVEVKTTNAFACSFSANTTINKLSAPTFTLQSFSNCEDSLGFVSAKILQSNGLGSYKWQNNNSIVNGSTVLLIRQKQTSNAVFTIKDSLGCQAIDSIKYIPFPLPNVEIIANSEYNWNEVILFDVNQSFEKYLWSTGNQTKSNAIVAKQFGQPGAYKIKCRVWDKKGCSNIDSFTFTTKLSNNINSNEIESVLIYPNPANETIVIELLENDYLKCFDLLGQLVFETKLNAGKNIINISELKNGTYLLETNLIKRKLLVLK